MNPDNDKTQFPNRIKKLYYKSIESIALNASPESCSKDNSRVLLRQISEESFFDAFNSKDLETLGIVAQNALEKCKLRPSKDIRYTSTIKGKKL